MKMASSLSYWHTPQSLPYMWRTLAQMLDERAEKQPDMEAYVVRRRDVRRESITYRQLAERSKALATSLKQRLGLGKDDRVIITGITCINWFVAAYACLRLGVHLLKCRMSLLSKEGLESIVIRNDVKALLYHPGADGQFENLLHGNFPELFTQKKSANLPSLQHLVSMSAPCLDGVHGVDELLVKDGTEDVPATHIDPDDVAVIFMTSGSTGDSKAVPLTHFTLVNTNHVGDLFPGRKMYFNDRALTWMASDMYMPIMVPDTTMVFVQPLTAATNQDFDYSLQVMREEQCNLAMLLQYMIHDMLDRFEGGREPPIHLQMAFSGGEVLQYELFQRASAFVKRWGFGYGSTEAMCVAVNDYRDDLMKQLEFAGKPQKGVEVKLVDLAGKVVPMGQQGEICVRSPMAFRGYLYPDTVGVRIDGQGWLHLDDGGIMNQEGYIKVLGRMSNVISRGITITYPKVVEDLLLKCPGVGKAAVVGVPDTRLGQEIAAFVVAKQGEELNEGILKQYFNNLYITDEGLGVTPGYFFVIDDFPLNVNGKVDLNALKEQGVKLTKK